MAESDWPQNINLTGFPLSDEIKQDSDLDTAHKKVSRFVDMQGSPVLFTFGTGIFDAMELFEIGMEACETIGKPALFVGGGDGSFIYSKKFMHVNYVDFARVFPQCALVVHHGGIGTTAQAIRAGVPQLIKPQAFDQFDNADKVLRLGVGLHIMKDNFTPEKLAKSLSVLVEQEIFRKRASYFSSLIQQYPTLERVGDYIENTITAPKPFRYLSHFKKSVIMAREKLMMRERVEIPYLKYAKNHHRFIRRKNRAIFEMLEILCAAHDTDHVELVGKDSYKTKNLELATLVEILKQQRFEVRVLSCEAQFLTEIKLPCLIHWRYERFILLCSLSEQGVVVRDPGGEQTEYGIEEFAWYYSNIAVEVGKSESNSD